MYQVDVWFIKRSFWGPKQKPVFHGWFDSILDVINATSKYAGEDYIVQTQDFTAFFGDDYRNWEQIDTELDPDDDWYIDDEPQLDQYGNPLPF